MIVKRVGAMSFAKVAGTLYAFMGLCFGAVLSLFAMIGAATVPDNPGRGLGMLFGVGAIVLLPILYGGIGFVFSLITAGLYNVVAGMVGGVEIDVQ